jgi:hypothetical protein
MYYFLKVKLFLFFLLITARTELHIQFRRRISFFFFFLCCWKNKWGPFSVGAYEVLLPIMVAASFEIVLLQAALGLALL